jgi:hypothetical protein
VRIEAAEPLEDVARRGRTLIAERQTEQRLRTKAPSAFRAHGRGPSAAKRRSK